jgi:hypothetical protein
MVILERRFGGSGSASQKLHPMGTFGTSLSHRTWHSISGPSVSQGKVNPSFAPNPGPP